MRVKCKRAYQAYSKRELSDIMVSIHSISNTVYNHFHIFAETSFIFSRDGKKFFLSFVRSPGRLSMSAEQDTYNSIFFNAQFTYNVFTLILSFSRIIDLNLLNVVFFSRRIFWWFSIPRCDKTKEKDRKEWRQRKKKKTRRIKTMNIIVCA